MRATGQQMPGSAELSRTKESSEVAAMFDRISPRYDLLNRVLSFRRDVTWRNQLGRYLPEREDLRLLDLATGTGDVILALLKQRNRFRSVVGLDMSPAMLALAKGKIGSLAIAPSVALVEGNASAIPFDDAAFDLVTIAFGIRNVEKYEVALREMYRVLTKGGTALILEFSLPTNPLIRSFHLGYFRHVLPRVGGLISGDRAAYQYLNRTAESFPYGEAFCALLRAAGFSPVSTHPMTFGVATIYVAHKN